VSTIHYVNLVIQTCPSRSFTYFARNTRLHCQQGNNALGSALQHTLGWHFLGELKNPVVRWSPLIRLIAWYNGQRMNRYISKVLHHRFEEMKRDGSELLPKRSAIDLALADYLSGAGKGRTTLDPNFEKWAVTQLRLFFFVGHDSTSPTICYCFYLLSKYPDALRKLRDEHDAVFGQDRSHLSKILCEKPHLLNQLTYTNAVLKETLRLYPPAGGFRAGAPGVYLYDTKGNKYPTEGTMVWVLHPSLQRNPLYWKDAHVFIPERWLVSPDDPLYPMKGAWRPFEFGKRDCLGQNLAMLDLRVSIAMLVREFDISDAYDEWDRMYPQKRSQTVNGERAYQVGNGGAHPADGFPCRVSLRK
jgi:cytochrome P450